MVTSRANTSPVSQSTAGSANFSTRNAASQGAYGSIGADSSIAGSGDMGQISDRVRSIFDNRQVDIAIGGDEPESAEQRIARIAADIQSGRRGFSDIRRSVDMQAGSANQTLASAGLPTVEQPQLRPEDLSQILAARRAASSGFQNAEADALQAEAQRRAQQQIQEQRLAQQYEDFRDQMMMSAGDRGMAFQPVGAGRGMRDAAEGEARDLGQSRFGFESDLAGIAQRVAAARRMRDQQLAQIDAEEQALRSGMVRDELANFGNF